MKDRGIRFLIVNKKFNIISCIMYINVDISTLPAFKFNIFSRPILKFAELTLIFY